MPTYVLIEGNFLSPMGAIADTKRKLVADIFAFRKAEEQAHFEKTMYRPFERVPGYGIYVVYRGTDAKEYTDSHIKKIMREMALFYLETKMHGKEGYYSKYSYKVTVAVDPADTENKPSL